MVFLLNFILDFFILYGVLKVLKRNKKIYRLLLGSLVGSLTTFLLLVKISSGELFLCKILLSCLIIIVSFGKEEFFKNLSYFYLISIILGGCFYLLDLGVVFQGKGLIIAKDKQLFNFIFLIGGSLVIIFLFIREQLQYKSTYSDKYIVKIYINKKCYDLEGMIDTGNRLKDPYKKRDVILVNLKLDRRYKYIYVPYKALNTEGVIPCLKPDKVVIAEKEFSNCLIGFSKDHFALDGANCILPNTFKEEL